MKQNNIIFIFVIFMIITSVYFNVKVLMLIDEVQKTKTEVTGKATFGYVQICFNNEPGMLYTNCDNLSLRGRLDGLLLGEYQCTIQGFDGDEETLAFSEAKRWASFRIINQTTANLTLAGDISEPNNTRPENISLNISICDDSGCPNDCGIVEFKFLNITYRSQVLLLENYPSNQTDVLHIQNMYYDPITPYYYYHNYLDNHFLDVDGFNLTFEFVHDSFPCLFINVEFMNDSQIRYSLTESFNTEDTGPCEAQFTATNPFNVSNITNLFYLHIDPLPPGDTSGGGSSSSGGSGGGTGAFPQAGLIGDPLSPKKCIIKNISCTNWTECVWEHMNSSEIDEYNRTQDGLQRRECSFFTNCPGDMRPGTKRLCDYRPNCHDGMLNCHEFGDRLFCEEKIDCGGPCEPCPNCTDWKKNGDEEGIDCGGSCDSCPTCYDRIKNCIKTEFGNWSCEIGVDCGGHCAPCANCSDNLKNCHILENGSLFCEEGIDCGGPCEVTCAELELALAMERFRLLSLLMLLLVLLAIGLSVKPMHRRLMNYLEAIEMQQTKNLILRSREYMSYFNNQIRLLSTDFDRYTDRDAKMEGDHLLFAGETTGYNIDRYSVSYDNDYADILKDTSQITINYAMYLDKIEHGRALLKEMVRNGIKPEYRVCKRTSSVLWDPNWEPDKYAKYETIHGKLVARTVEYVVSFRAKEREEAAKISEVIDKFSKTQGWDVPDVRITGEVAVPHFQKRILNSKKVKGQDLLVLTKDKKLEGFDGTSIFINDKLARFIK